MSSTLYHFHDPMCSWCWAYRPTWAALQTELPEGLRVQRVLGGLAPDSDEPMPEEMQAAIGGYWKRIEQVVPGTRFNHDFWTECSPRRSTYPACRAVAAVRLLDPEREEAMIEAIQRAYYLEAQNPSDDSTLIALATTLGFDAAAFTAQLASADTAAAFHSDLELTGKLPIQGFPSLVLRTANAVSVVPIDYNDHRQTLAQIRSALADG